MHAPTVDDGAGATIVFLPGGGGGYGTAQRVWQTVFSGGAGFEAYRVIIPYAVDEDLIDQALRTFDIIDEVLWCFGGDPMQVHLGGSSNGGLAAFGLMARAPERFATLVGAPGAFPVQDPSAVDAETWFELLAGRAVLNGVGAFDTEWRVEVIATHNALAGAGIESHFVEFPGQGHVLSPRFDSRALLEFWESHR
jgi:pimeloyl-ACP methyl ester carboxylesterase